MRNEHEKQIYHIDWKMIRRREWPLWLIMAGMFLGAIIIYPYLPPEIPGHWNLYGEVDAYYSKSWATFMGPALSIGMYLLMLYLPKFDPKQGNYQHFTNAYGILRWSIVLLFTFLFVVTMLQALGYNSNVGLLVKGAIAILFIMIGNYMGQFRHNYFVGIKTPWTLANEEVWQRTHRLGARIWVIGGIICLVMAPFQTLWAAAVYFAAILFMVLVPVVYSYLVYAQQN